VIPAEGNHPNKFFLFFSLFLGVWSVERKWKRRKKGMEATKGIKIDDSTLPEGLADDSLLPTYHETLALIGIRRLNFEVMRQRVTNQFYINKWHRERSKKCF